MCKDYNILTDIRFIIKNRIQQGYRKFVIFLFGDVRVRVKRGIERFLWDR